MNDKERNINDMLLNKIENLRLTNVAELHEMIGIYKTFQEAVNCRLSSEYLKVQIDKAI
jgi:hypothetical protein